MRRHIPRLFLLLLYLTSSLAAPVLIADPVTAQVLGPEEPPEPTDDRDAETREWEDQVANDARGDVAAQWPGTIDLLYLTMGEVYTLALRETYLFMRIGYNMTGPSDSDLDNEPITPPDPVPNTSPFLPSDDPQVAIRVNFRFDGEDHNLTLYRLSLQQGPWRSNSGQLIMERAGGEDEHDEILFFTPLRRWGIEPGTILDNITVEGYRDTSMTDTMAGFDVAGDYPYPFRDTLRPGPQGIPEGIPRPAEYVDWLLENQPRINPMDPTLPDDPETLVPEDPPEADLNRTLEDPHSGRAHVSRHQVQSGQERLVVRWDKTVVEADFTTIGQVNFTVENLFEETPQTVALLGTSDPEDRWLLGYAPGTVGTQIIAPGESARFSVIAAPFDLASSDIFRVAFIFLSDWGGFETRHITFVNTAVVDLDQDDDPRRVSGYLPPTIGVDILNKDDHFRVNEPRLVMVRVTDETGRPYSGFEEVRAFIHPVDERPPEKPYQLNLKYFTEGVYEVPFTFDRPGAWVVDVYFYDYQPDADGYPHIDFFLRVDYPGKSRPVVPTPLAIGGLGLGLTALAVNERLTKNR